MARKLHVGLDEKSRFWERNMISSSRIGRCSDRGRRQRARAWLAAVASVAAFDTLAVGPVGTPLYDASSAVIPADSSWGWRYCCFSGVTSMIPGATVIDTTAIGFGSGYDTFGPAWAGMVLNSAAGFTLTFSLRVASESHFNNNRAGFSIIVLDSTARGVELAFWTDQVWAQNANFTHGESFATNTQSAARTYTLTFSSGLYSLAIDGTQQLSGALRDYAPAGPPAIYANSNYIFFGDDTTSAMARTELSSITLAPIPEPQEWALMLAGLGCVAAAARRRRRPRMS
jgi:hypothetical protein